MFGIIGGKCVFILPDVFNINVFFIESCWEGWMRLSQEGGEWLPHPPVLPTPSLVAASSSGSIPRTLTPQPSGGLSGGLSGETKKPGAKTNEGPAEDQRKQTYRQLKPSM